MSIYVLIAILLGLLVGAVVGVLSGGFGQALLYGGVIWSLAGWLVDLNRRVGRLESAEEQRAVASRRTERAPEAKAPERSVSVTSARPAEQPTSVGSKRPPSESTRGPTADSAWAPGTPPLKPEDEPDPSLVGRGLAVARVWFTTGNVPVKVGVVVVLFGVAFFINYAIDRQLFSFPVWARLSGVALFGAAMLAVGWRLRKTREIYALSLQGGGLGILYLTTYAAFGFYALLPATVAFSAMVGVTVATGVLALFQDSRVLVVLGVAGGFLAPLLAATETGSHVQLFSYYAVLNAAILAIAWFKAWRPLNLLGFAFTFVIGSLWGYQAYRPEPLRHDGTVPRPLRADVYRDRGSLRPASPAQPARFRRQRAGVRDAVGGIHAAVPDRGQRCGAGVDGGEPRGALRLADRSAMADQGSPSPSHVVLRSGAVVPGDGHPACLGRPLDLDRLGGPGCDACVVRCTQWRSVADFRGLRAVRCRGRGARPRRTVRTSDNARIERSFRGRDLVGAHRMVDRLELRSQQVVAPVAVDVDAHCAGFGDHVVVLDRWARDCAVRGRADPFRVSRVCRRFGHCGHVRGSGGGMAAAQ